MEQPQCLRGEIFVVDDDVSVREAFTAIFALDGYQVTGFDDGPSFLDAVRFVTPACVLLDIQMPGMSGLDVLKMLNVSRFSPPIFIISGQANIAAAVEAIKHGAVDVIEQPFDAAIVSKRVGRAIGAWTQRKKEGTEGLSQHFPGQELLTPREREVLGRIASGASNKEAGRILGISPRTVEVHRARIMEKLHAKNAADLVRIVLSDSRIHPFRAIV